MKISQAVLWRGAIWRHQLCNLMPEDFSSCILCLYGRRDIAEMMGHADVDMQFTYKVGVDENKRQGAERLGNELVRISQISPNASRLVN